MKFEIKHYGQFPISVHAKVCDFWLIGDIYRWAFIVAIGRKHRYRFFRWRTI